MMKTEMRNPNTETPKLRRKTGGQRIRPRGLSRLPVTKSFPVADRGSPAPPQDKSNGGVRKLRVDAKWRQFTQAQQDHIREILERDGQEAAAVYCRKIRKSWSGSSISRFIHSERAAGSSPDLTRDTKLRSDSGWWQLTEREQDKLRKIFERDGQMAAEKYCRNIGKPWSHTAISRCLAKERAARRAENAEMRQRLARLKTLTADYANAGMGITEATALNLTAKLRDSVESSAADPMTPKGRAIITKAAPLLIALRALELRREFKSKEVGLEERRVAALEKKLAKALKQNAEPKINEHIQGATDEQTEALGRLIYGDTWDLEDRVAEPRPEAVQTTGPTTPSPHHPTTPGPPTSHETGVKGNVEPNGTQNTETKPVVGGVPPHGAGTGDTPRQT